MELEEGAEHYAAIQPVLDLLQSPLFSALVDIKNSYQKVGNAYLIVKSGKFHVVWEWVWLPLFILLLVWQEAGQWSG